MSRFIQFINSGGTYLVGSILERSLPVLFLPIYTQYLSVEDYGVYSILTLLILWPEKFVSAPVANGITRYYYSPEFSAQRGSLIFTGYVFTFIQSVFFGLIILLFSRQISILLFDDVNFTKYVTMFAVVMFFQPLATLMASLARIQDKARLFVTVNIFVYSTAAILQLILLKYLNFGIMAMVVGFLYVSILTFALYLRNAARIVDWSFSKSLLKEILFFGYPLVIAALVALGTQTLDRVWLLKKIDIKAVGLLAIAYKVPLILDFLITVPLKQTLLPLIYKMEEIKNEQLAFVKRITTHLTAFVVCATLFLALISEELIVLLTTGEEYVSASIVVPFLLFSSANQSLALLFGNGLSMAKRTFLISLTSIYVFLLYFSMLALLVPKFGLIGVGMASSSAYVFRNIIRGYLSFKYYGQTFDIGRIVTLVILGFIFYYIGSTLAFDNFWLGFIVKMGISILFILFVYAGTVFSFSEVELAYRGLVKNVKNK